MRPQPAEPTSKNILFVMWHVGFVRNYDVSLRLLAERGHRIRIAYLEERPSKREQGFAEGLVRAHPNVTVVRAPATESGAWGAFAQRLRLLLDYVRYLDSRYEHATALRERIDGYVPRWVRAVSRPVGLFGDRGVAATIRLLQRLEGLVPPSRRIREFLEEVKPDVLLVTPLIDFEAGQVDYVKAARALGIPSALCVASWDNLTNKGHMRVVPDRVFVWNEAQKNEAVSLHGASPSAVVSTGAQLFDHWFAAKPSRSREEFCRRVGLDPERPFVLFLGSSTWLAPDEVYFVERWIRAIRNAADPSVARLGVLIRPHPTNAARRYLSLDLSGIDNAALWPEFTEDQSLFDSESFKEDFFDSLHYSVACVGVNTSAQIEAAIVGRPVCTIHCPEFAHAHDGTLHFAHLADERSGLVRIADGMDAHLHDLAEIVAGNGMDRQRAHAFVEGFVRPRGLDVPAAPILADEIETVASLSIAPASASRGSLALRAALYPFASLARLLPARAKPAREPSPPWLGAVRQVARARVRLWVQLVIVRAALDPKPLRKAFRLRLHRLRKRARGLLLARSLR